MWEGKRRKNSIDSRLWKRDSRRGRVLELKLSVHAGGDFIGSLTAIDRGGKTVSAVLSFGTLSPCFLGGFAHDFGKDLEVTCRADEQDRQLFLDG